MDQKMMKWLRNVILCGSVGGHGMLFDGCDSRGKDRNHPEESHRIDVRQHHVVHQFD